MAKHLPARPNLEHLRKQAKALLRETPAKVRASGFRLADAQLVIARQAGFASWPLLSRHVEQLRQLEGEWQFASLQVDGVDMPAAALGQSRLLIDGDRFRMESPEAIYEGELTIDVSEEPARIDIEFVEGPEAGNWSYGIYELDGDQLTMCLGLTGAVRPVAFATSPGSGHALERLRRATANRPERVTGGTRTKKPAPAAAAAVSEGEAKRFDAPMTPLMRRLEGEWSAVELIRDGTPMPSEWLGFGSRVTTGNEVKVTFGGQVMVHAKVAIDERTSPMAVDYLNLTGSQKNHVSLGITEWIGEDVRFLMAVPGQPRPVSFDAPGKGQTLSRWRKR